MQIRKVAEADLRQLAQLFDAHTSALMPGWGLRLAGLQARLRQAEMPGEEVETLVALDGGSVSAATHIRRFEDEDGPGAEIGWVVSWPGRQAALQALLRHGLKQLADLPEDKVLLSQELYVPVFVGICSPWKHLRAGVTELGFSHLPQLNEAAYAGPLICKPPPEPAVDGLELTVDLGKFGTRFIATIDGEHVSQCECCFEFAEFEAVPAMQHWVELSEIETRAPWQSQGIGTWTVQHAVNWLQAGGFTDAILNVAEDDEQRGAGKFYQRFGWRVVCRQQKGWKRR